ncbi:hypothetical protein EDC30_102239 [Paucimonas lemoignei]|uniref:DUF3102 domain-containing protein n=1 Tax=Paucimonas lemoignei TaxID=29443 RepID=A0A4V2UJ33_PAULE|nr:DUF3102 domain-containing protein [Paucimonas lemoignei]TCS38500.1 hypothetical protein EDC30_102239 [Paucimonas lemoignei]
MARKKNETTVEQTEVDNEALQQGATALVEVSANAAKVAELMGYDLPYNQERVVQEARFYMGQSAEAMLEAGKRLVLLKENEGHGEFIQIVEERLGIPARTAQLMMQAAVKYLTNPALTSKAQTFALLGKSKLFELMTLDDDSLNELAEGGTVANLNLDEIDRMSVRELKAALRESRETAEATDKVLASKNKKIDQLTTELERKKTATPADEWEWAPARRALLDSSETIANLAQSELRRALVDIQEQAATSGHGDVPEEMEVLQAQALTSVMQALIALQKEFRINVDLEALVSPPWMKDFQASSSND